MKALIEMNRKVSAKFGDKLKQFCSPLVTHLGINHFYHYAFTDSGKYIAVGLDLGWQEYLTANEIMDESLYNFYHNRYKLKGILFTQTLSDQVWQDLAKDAGHDFNIHIGLQISQPFNGGIEGFGFGLKSADLHQHMTLLKELPLLNLFIHQYKNQFNQNALKDNFIDLPEAIGPSFHKKPPVDASLNTRELILGKMKINVQNSFSKRETEVIQLLLKGSPTSSQLAEQLFLSKRTVDDHLEHIKGKLDCASKSEMMQKLKQLDSFGFLF